MPDIYNLLMGAPPQADETAQALSAQIRRQRGAAMAGALADRKEPIGVMSGLQADFAKQDQGMLERATEQRMRYGEEAKNRELQHKMAVEQMRGLARMQRQSALQPVIDSADEIAEAIRRGEQPPDMKGLYRVAPFVRAKLAKMGYDLTNAQMDWHATDKHINSLNSTQQNRLRQQIQFGMEALPLVKALYADMRKSVPSLGHSGVNKFVLEQVAKTGTDAGMKAQKLLTMINDLQDVIGTVYMGGNTPTDYALKQAGENLKGNWTDKTFNAAIQLLDTNLAMRYNSIRHTTPIGARGGENRYWQQGGGASGSFAPTGEGLPAAPGQGQAQAERKRVRVDAEGNILP